MTDTATILTTPLVVPVSARQVASLLGESPAPVTRLLTVREIREDEGGATLLFLQGGRGRLANRGADYANHLRLAQRSRDRQHPAGVRFGEGLAVLELLRADNDVPAHLDEEGTGRARVHFQGHDGVFHLSADHPEGARLRALLAEAIRQQAQVWFLAQKPDLALLDVLAA